MLTIQMLGLPKRDEELRAVGVWPRVCHRKHASLLVFVCVADRMLVLEGLPPETLAPSACACRIASLDHKPRYQAMEDCLVVLVLLRKLDEVVAGSRRSVGKELQVDLAHVCDELCIRLGRLVPHVLVHQVLLVPECVLGLRVEGSGGTRQACCCSIVRNDGTVVRLALGAQLLVN